MAEFQLSAFADEAQETADGQIAALVRNGIPFIEPRNLEGKSLLSLPEDEILSFRKKLDRAHIRVYSYGSPIGKTDVSADFDVQLEAFDKALTVCKILGADYMRVFSFFVGNEKRHTVRNEVLRRMNVLLDRAEKKNITLCHENESLIYGQNPEEVADLLSSLPRLKGIYDGANYVMNGCDPLDGFRQTLSSLQYLHVKDCVASEKKIVPVGEGDGAYETILRALESVPGRFTLTLEPHLKEFTGYRTIDRHVLKTGHVFESGDAAFDCAADALKTLLLKIGYREENNVWKK